MIGLMKGLSATISHLFTKKVTIQYPEERRELPQRSRGLIRLRLKDDAHTPRCISCTFCEQICPAVAIKIIYDNVQPEDVWSLDAGAGPMLSWRNRGDHPIGLPAWPQDPDAKAAPRRSGCLANSLLDAGALSQQLLEKTAARNGVWLAQVFGIATFYDQLRSRGATGPQPAVVSAQTPKLPPAERPEQLPEHFIVEGTPAILLAGHGTVNPENIDSYASAGGYKAAERILTEMAPVDAVNEIAGSGLRGRGGAGYPTADKWRMALETEAPQKYIICNADEGDLGSVKDRSLLENNPHAVIEGMIIAGYAVGASEGIIYISSENGLAVERMRTALEQAEDNGFLEEELPGTDFSFSIRLAVVPGSYIGGEETVVISVLEGKRPMTRVRPPYPAENGLYGMPTVVENVETLAIVPWIINNGAAKFKAIGSPNAPGTRLYDLKGAVARPGIYEATLDTTLKQLVNDSAGGFTGEPKAALVGSTGGGFLSPGLFDIPLDFDSIRETGGDISSGTIEVLGQDECIVDWVRDGLAFSSNQSCGKCVPCRLGVWRLHDMMDNICIGNPLLDEVAVARDLAQDIRDGALCGLGRRAVGPLLTGLQFFGDEFEEHSKTKKCPLGKCAGKPPRKYRDDESNE